MLANEECIAMGGGGNFAWYIDNELKEGNSGPCKTFGNPMLSHEENWEAIGGYLFLFINDSICVHGYVLIYVYIYIRRIFNI
jgi:hypothetical protein